jgi:hypothetical protein
MAADYAGCAEKLYQEFWWKPGEPTPERRAGVRNGGED